MQDKENQLCACTPPQMGVEPLYSSTPPASETPGERRLATKWTKQGRVQLVSCPSLRPNLSDSDREREGSVGEIELLRWLRTHHLAARQYTNGRSFLCSERTPPILSPHRSLGQSQGEAHRLPGKSVSHSAAQRRKRSKSDKRSKRIQHMYIRKGLYYRLAR